MNKYINKEDAKKAVKDYFYALIDMGVKEVDVVDTAIDVCKILEDLPYVKLGENS